MCEFKLSTVITKWHDFILEHIPSLYCINVDHLDIYICIELSELNKKYKELNPNQNTHNITANNASHYLSKYLNRNMLLRRPVGYSELLTVLLSQYYTTDPQNSYFNGIDGETLEKAFHSHYKSRCVYEAPFIQDVLNKICQISIDPNQCKVYKLVASSKQYFDTQPSAFAPILHRSLKLTADTMTGTVSNGQSMEHGEDLIPQSPFNEDRVSVFMGGFSHGTTVEDLRTEIAKRGLFVVLTLHPSHTN